MDTVKDILKLKGNNYYWVSQDDLAINALEKMSVKDVGALMVLDKGKLIGIFSERDYARKMAGLGKSCEGLKVSDMMSTKVYHVMLDTTINDCMTLMTEKHIRHLPVLDSNEIAGMVSIGDIVNNIIHQQKTVISSLENYIIGG
jgi:CBS domain-containing protein